MPQVPFAVGYLYLVLLAWLLAPPWRTLQASVRFYCQCVLTGEQWVLAGPNCLFLLLWWAVPESPRWLASQHKAARALRSVGVAARCNSRPPPAHHLLLAGDKPGQQGQEQGKILLLQWFSSYLSGVLKLLTDKIQ